MRDKPEPKRRNEQTVQIWRSGSPGNRGMCNPMDEVVLSGVRAFRDEVRIPIRPLTILVGENSTGKSTVLAMIRAAWDLAREPSTPDFTEPPFDLGSYDSIAHYHGGQAKRVDHFTIGSVTRGTVLHDARAEFRQRDGQPELFRLTVTDGSNVIDARVDGAGKPSVTATEAGVPLPIPREAVTEHRWPRGDAMRGALFLVERAAFAQPRKGNWEGIHTLVEHSIYGGVRRGREPRPHASAPIRSEPERTYNPKRSLQVPGGEHVPMALASLRRTSPDAFKSLIEELGAFGEASGLYKTIDVKLLGKKASDPFQVQVGVERYAFNLMDVGYGVSQVLPLLFDALTESGPRTFLLQQPEVHLHPRAQAALGSFFVQRAKKTKRRFVVETHSDYLVDRARTEVRKGTLPPADVALLFFERSGGVVKMHRMTLDEQGNIVDAPTVYRQFFLDETRESLGID